MSDSSPRGRFVWHELIAADPESAGRFYARVVGWRTEAWSQDPTYTFFMLDETPKAGLLLQPEGASQAGAPPHWLTYIGIANVDATLQKALSLGATNLHGPEDIPTIGRFAVLRDPQGAVFAIFTPSDAATGPPAGAAPGLGEFSWHELATTDWEAALAFYRDLFGWEQVSAMDMSEGKYVMFGFDGQMLGGIYTMPAGMPGPPNWLPYIKVSDSHAAAATAQTMTGRILNGPMEVPGGDWIAQGLDSQGAMFAVHSAKPAVAAAVPDRRKPARSKRRVAASRATTPAAKAPSSKAPAAAPAAKSARKAPARKAAPTRKAAARKKVAAKTAGVSKTGPKAGVAKKAVARKVAAKKSAARRPTVKAAKTVAKKTSPRKPAAKKAASRKATAPRAAKKASGRKAAASSTRPRGRARKRSR
ncbi:MAG: VOC family protein [Vicinamibacterales bacterium]